MKIAPEDDVSFAKLLAAYTKQCELWVKNEGDAVKLYETRKEIDAYVAGLEKMIEAYSTHCRGGCAMWAIPDGHKKT